MRTFFHFVYVTVMIMVFAWDGRSEDEISGNEEETIIFDAEKDDAGSFENMTSPWIEGSDYKPQSKVVETAGGKWLEFSYTGSAGMARSNLLCEKTVQDLLQAGKTIVGAVITIDYENDDMGKLDFLAHTQAGEFCLTEPLEKGTKKYLFRSGFSHEKPSWGLLSRIGIWNKAENGYAKGFRLKRIALLTLKNAKGAKALKIGYVRPVREIYASSSPLDGDGKFKVDYEWSKLAEITKFGPLKEDNGAGGWRPDPVKANIGYDDDHLFFRIEAEYPTRPLSNVRQNDMEVWQDEALELFFSGRHDNDRKIQFVINANGVVFDYLRDFDAVAASVIDNIKWNLPHHKNLLYANGKMIYKLAFPLKELKADIAVQPFIGFQMAQDYVGREAYKLQTLRWSNDPEWKPNPDPYAFGFLVFNHEPFGGGTVKEEKVDGMPLSNRNEFDLRMKVLLSGFTDGTYIATQWLAAPDHTVSEKREELALKDDRSLTFYLPGMKNLNGTYTWTLGIKNETGNTRLFSMNFSNNVDLMDLFGTHLLWPRPKNVSWAPDGVFRTGEKHSLSVQENSSERTLLTAKLFQEKLLGYAGSEYKVVKGGSKDIVLRIGDKVKFNDKMETLKPEGYHLKVTPELVEITGADEPGLYYGTQTFIQLLKMPMKSLAGAPAKCVEILDWPDLPKRLARFSFPPDQIGNKVEEKTSVDHLLSWVDRFVAGNKFNMFSMHADSMTIFKRRPEANFNLENREFTLEDWRKIAEFCRERFIKLIPALPAGGHDYWLTMANPEFRERGWDNMADVAHPDYFPAYRDCALDIIEATGCEYFSPNLDEWWHERKPGETPDELIHGKTRPQAMLDFVLQLHRFLKEHQVRLVAFEDMFSPLHNGRRYDVYKITDELPKDIIIAPWAWVGGVQACTEYFYNKGFTELWGNGTGFATIPGNAKRFYSAYGDGLYGPWGGGFPPNCDEPGFLVWMANWFRGSDYAWNFQQGNECSVDDEINSGVFPALSEMFAVNPNPYASQEIIPFDIVPSLNTSLAKFAQDNWPDEYKSGGAPVTLPEGETSIGNIPTRFSNESANCAIVGQKQRVEFPVSGKFSSLIFLHSVINPRDMKKELVQVQGLRTWHMGWPLGSYLIEYADGATAKFTVHFGLDLYWLRSRPLGGATVCNRYIYHPEDTNGANMFLYQSEWVNPWPEKEIRKLSFQNEPRIPLKTIIFAISGRKVKSDKKETQPSNKTV